MPKERDSPALAQSVSRFLASSFLPPLACGLRLGRATYPEQTIRYHGLYSNKTRGKTPLTPDRIISASKTHQSEIQNLQSEILLIPAPPKQSASDMRLSNHPGRRSRNGSPTTPQSRNAQFTEKTYLLRRNAQDTTPLATNSIHDDGSGMGAAVIDLPGTSS